MSQYEQDDMSSDKTLCEHDIRMVKSESSTAAGILLRRFLGDPGLEGVSHVVIDEVHERSVETDLSLLLLRDLLNQGSSIKVILMSATANAELFASYFSKQVTICLSEALPSIVILMSNLAFTSLSLRLMSLMCWPVCSAEAVKRIPVLLSVYSQHVLQIT